MMRPLLLLALVFGATLAWRWNVIEPIRKFLAAYDRVAVNGLRPGLADECYAIDGGDDVEGGASLKISDLRATVAALDAAQKDTKRLVEAVILLRRVMPIAADAKHEDFTDLAGNEDSRSATLATIHTFLTRINAERAAAARGAA